MPNLRRTISSIDSGTRPCKFFSNGAKRWKKKIAIISTALQKAFAQIPSWRTIDDGLSLGRGRKARLRLTPTGPSYRRSSFNGEYYVANLHIWGMGWVGGKILPLWCGTGLHAIITRRTPYKFTPCLPPTICLYLITPMEEKGLQPSPFSRSIPTVTFSCVEMGAWPEEKKINARKLHTSRVRCDLCYICSISYWFYNLLL